MEHFDRKPGISEATLTPPNESEIVAGMDDTFYGCIQRLRRTRPSTSVREYIRAIFVRRHDYPLPWWQSMHLFGKIYAFQGLEKKAEALYRVTFAEVWSTLPREYHHAIDIAEDLAWSISMQDRFNESLQWYSWVLNASAKIPGGRNQRLLMYRIASVHESRSITIEASSEK